MMPHDDVILRKFVQNRYPNSGFGFHGSTRPITSLEGLKVNGVTHDLTIDDFNAFKEKEIIDYNSLEYARKRQQEYPDLQECIHAILDDDLTALQAKRKLVKEKYPKPE
jgi:hypothetical protein